MIENPAMIEDLFDAIPPKKKGKIESRAMIEDLFDAIPPKKRRKKENPAMTEKKESPANPDLFDAIPPKKIEKIESPAIQDPFRVNTPKTAKTQVWICAHPNGFSYAYASQY